MPYNNSEEIQEVKHDMKEQEYKPCYGTNDIGGSRLFINEKKKEEKKKRKEKIS